VLHGGRLVLHLVQGHRAVEVDEAVEGQRRLVEIALLTGARVEAGLDHHEVQRRPSLTAYWTSGWTRTRRPYGAAASISRIPSAVAGDSGKSAWLQSWDRHGALSISGGRTRQAGVRLGIG
jgi:hypothetical protein